MKIRLYTAAFLVFLGFVSLMAQETPKAGQLDTSFGDKGYADIATEWDIDGDQVRVDSKGRIYMFAKMGKDGMKSAYVVRLNANGTLDTSFGESGYYILESSSKMPIVAFFSGAIDKQGRIYAVGYFHKDKNSIVVVRLTEDGKPDITWGEKGLAIMEHESISYYANRMIIADNGDVYVGGYYAPPSSPDYGLIMRLTPEGEFDDSFGQGGKVVPDLGAWSYVSNLMIDTEQRLVVSMWYGESAPNGGIFKHSLVGRFDLNGQLDASFGEYVNGEGRTIKGIMDYMDQVGDWDAYPEEIRQLKSGNYVLGAFSRVESTDGKKNYVQGVLVGINATDGKVLQDFGKKGVTTFVLHPTGSTYIEQIEVAPKTGNIYVFGSTVGYDTTLGEQRYYMVSTVFDAKGKNLAHYGVAAERDGDPVPNMGYTSILSKVGHTSFGVCGGALQPDGKVILGSSAYIDKTSPSHLVFFRYHTDESISGEVFSEQLSPLEGFMVQPLSDGLLQVVAPEGEPYSVELFDMQGHRLAGYPASPRVVDTSWLSNGMYVLRVLSGEGMAAFTFLR